MPGPGQTILVLANDHFDTGTITHPGEYPLADKTYEDLLDRLAKDHFAGVRPELREDILDYCRDPNGPFATKNNKRDWTKVMQEIQGLEAATVAVSSRALP
jgi:hypothetical protein